jgi:hypothetical protein
MHERVTHLLDAGECVLELLPCVSERVTDCGIDVQLFQRSLFELFSSEELAGGHNEHMRVELLGAEPAGPTVVFIPHPEDG